MPELPEVEITARRLHASLAGAEVESALAPGMVALKSVEPPLGALAGRRIAAVRRIGKMLVVDFGPAGGGRAGEGGARAPGPPPPLRPPVAPGPPPPVRGGAAPP